MVNTIKKRREDFRGTQKGGVSNAGNIAIGIGTLGAVPLLTKAREKITGETSYYGAAVYKDANQLLKDLSTIKKGKTLELMGVWTSEDKKKWFTSYKWAEKIFTGFTKFIEDIINKKIGPPASDIDTNFLNTYKRSKVMRIILGMTFMLCQQANLTRTSIIKFINDVKAIENPQQSTTSTQPIKSSVQPSKQKVREDILKKIIELVNTHIRQLNTSRPSSDSSKKTIPEIPIDAKEERVIKSLYIEIKRAVIQKAKEEKDYLEEEASLENNLTEYHKDLQSVKAKRETSLNVSEGIIVNLSLNSNIDKLRQIVNTIKTPEFQNKLSILGQSGNKIISDLLTKADIYIMLTTEEINALNPNISKQYNELTAILINQLTKIINQINSAHIKKEESENINISNNSKIRLKYQTNLKRLTELVNLVSSEDFKNKLDRNPLSSIELKKLESLVSEANIYISKDISTSTGIEIKYYNKTIELLINQLNEFYKNIDKTYITDIKMQPKMEDQRKINEIKDKINLMKLHVQQIHDRFYGLKTQLKVPLDRNIPQESLLLSKLSDLNSAIRNYSSFFDLNQTYQKYIDFKKKTLEILTELINVYNTKKSDTNIYTGDNKTEIDESIKILADVYKEINTTLTFEGQSPIVGGSLYKYKTKKLNNERNRKSILKSNHKTIKAKNRKNKTKKNTKNH